MKKNYKTKKQWMAVLLLAMVFILSNSANAQSIGNIYGVNNSDETGFLTDISADGTVLITSNPRHSGHKGRTQIYRWSGSAWSLEFNVVGVNANDRFGSALAISGDATTVAIGVGSDDTGGTDAGAVRIYKWSGSVWNLTHTFNGAAGDEMGQTHENVIGGNAVALNSDGTVVGIGAYDGAGYVKVYTSNALGVTWTQRGATLTSSTAATHQVELSNDGTVVAVGSASTNPLVDVYAWNGTVWNQRGTSLLQIVTNERSMQLDMNGDGTAVVMGQAGYNSDKGGVRVHRYDSGSNTWSVSGTSINGTFTFERVGSSVAINDDGTRFAVGGYGYLSFFGRVRTYDWNGSAWVLVDTENGASSSNFGDKALAFNADGSVLAAGGNLYDIPGGDPNVGFIKVYTPTATVYTWDGSTDTDWDTASNWDTNAAPSSIGHQVVIPASQTVTAATDITFNKITMGSDSKLTVTGTITSGTTSSVLNSGASLIAKDNSNSGFTFTYNRTLTADWHLVSSPVVGETIEDLRTNNNFVSSANITNAIALATYNTAGSGNGDYWNYHLNSDTGTISSGVGYSAKLTAAGDLSYTGTMPTADYTYTLTQGGHRANLVGNPYPSYITIASLDQTDLNEATVWVWDSASALYRVNAMGITGFPSQFGDATIAPGQGFFVKSKNGGGTYTLSESLQSHTSSAFHRTGSPASINLKINNGSLTREAQVYYLDGATTGFDNGYDGTILDESLSGFELFTHLLSNNEGKPYGVQTLPNTAHETTVIPVGVSSEVGTLTFTGIANDLPNGLNLFLEDRVTNTFTQLDLADASYEVTLDSDLQGIGRFYLHTTTEAALSTDDVSLSGVSIYKTTEDNLRISGVQNEHVTMTIYNVLGAKVLQTSFEGTGENDVDVSRLKTGYYIIKLTTVSGKLNKKIILE